jgi:DNA-binding SARP family transcriptional activator
MPGGPQKASTEDLEQALSLVRGRPFEGIAARRYAWAEPIRQEMISAIVDASYELGRRRLIDGRWRAAEQAIVIGLAVEPGMERLWRARILAAHASGNHAALQEVIDRLEVIAEELGGDLEPETERLIKQVQNPATRRGDITATAL